MITESELIDIVKRNMHLFQQQFQVKQNLIFSKIQHQKPILGNRQSKEQSNYQRLDLWTVNSNKLVQQRDNSFISPIFQRKHIWQTTNNNQHKISQQQINPLQKTLPPKKITYQSYNFDNNQQQSQMRKTLVIPTSQQKTTPSKFKNQLSNNNLSHYIQSSAKYYQHQPQQIPQKINIKRRHKIFSLPSHQPNHQLTNIPHNQIAQTIIIPSSKTYSSSLSKTYKQNQNINLNTQQININPSVKINLLKQKKSKQNSRKHQLLSNDYLPSPLELSAILKSISNQSRSAHNSSHSIHYSKCLRGKRQSASIRYHEGINYEPINWIEMTKKYGSVNPKPQMLNCGPFQTSKIKFNYVDSKYNLSK